MSLLPVRPSGPFLWLLASLFASAAAAAEKIDFSREIRPILSDKCFKCHGFDDKKRQAGLRLDSREGALAEADSGLPAIVPGDAAKSELVRRILSADPEQRMPPAGTGKTLSDAEIEKLKTWVAEGAEYRPHWSFTPPQRPLPPQTKSAVKSPLDAFVVARLEKAGLAPSPPADKGTLLRRVTFDLTGLPPTLAEREAFLADDSPEAYERVVDRLLRSPRYGEHMARYWLDAARYGDTHGLHFDNERSLWPYRDYVIAAFNDNKPFDQFVVEQMAGDLLPNATLEQKVATGFNRCNVSTSEGGSINEEVLVRYAVDRVETLSTVFLGLTLGCAVCHEHKYDPITQKEFYQLFAFFNASADAAMDGNQLAPPPVVKVATPEQTKKFETLERELAALKSELAEKVARHAYVDPTPDGAAAGKALAEPQEFVWIDDAAPKGAKLQGNSPWNFVAKGAGPVHSGAKSHTRRAAGLSQHFFTGASPPLKVGGGDTLFAYVYLDPNDPPKTVMLQWNDGQWEHRAYWGEDAITFGAGDTPGHRRLGDLPAAGEWTRLEAPAEKVGLADGAQINGWAFSQFGGTVYWDRAGIVTRTPQDGAEREFVSFAQWDAYQRSLPKPALTGPLVQALKTAPDKRNEDQRKQLLNHFLENVYPPLRAELAPLQGRIAALGKERDALDKALPSSMVMQDLPKPRDTYLLIRGEYDKKDKELGLLQPAVPAALGTLPEGAPLNRLGLAQWLVSPDQPLVARVTVNRFWQQYFGVGLVKTAEDFGAQGEWPTHPELIDWLAREFIDSGWDVKRLQKLIVMSGTYRQSSRLTPQLLQKDPANELLSRGPRFRLDAEVVRDSMLSLGGLLVEKIGGRGVRPYQPEGIWEAVAFRGSNTQNFKADQGESLYRRSLYTFWKRTAPPPSLMAFDAPSREACTVRRSRTNTPLQALVLMNDQQYVEAARMFAQRVLREGGAAAPERLRFAFRAATAREPAPEELAVLQKALAQRLADYTGDEEAARKLLAVGETKADASLAPAELAAYTLVCNLILNLDEVVTKE